MRTLQAHLLLASPKLRDPNFAKTVILMVSHDESGALGLVLNRPLEVKLKSAWELISPIPCELDTSLHHGGPCEGPLMVLHNQSDLSEREILPGVHLSAGKQSIEQLVHRRVEGAHFFVGHSGWSPGQLESELQEQAWVPVPATTERIFSAEPDSWRDLMKVVALSLQTGISPDKIPDDPSVN
jgi:putative transcriptional regulator